jgi:hypothetical protein
MREQGELDVSLLRLAFARFINPKNGREPKTHVIEGQFIVSLTKFDELELK